MRMLATVWACLSGTPSSVSTCKSVAPHTIRPADAGLERRGGGRRRTRCVWLSAAVTRAACGAGRGSSSYC
eukprot:366542-Chlamydomonas_euryale.AAC.3